MTGERLPFVARCVLALLRLAPRSFRERFGDEIAWVFAEQWRHASPLGRIALTFGGALDLCSVAAQERGRQLRNLLKPATNDSPTEEDTMPSTRNPNHANAREALLSLLPGRTPGPLAEPDGRARRRADRQLDAYRQLRGLDWDTKWSVWTKSWAAVAADPVVLALRLTLLAGIAFAAWLGPMLVIPFIGATDPWLTLLLIPLSPLVTLTVLGMPLALALRPFLIRRVARHLVLP